MPNKTAAIILAAGDGTRMKSSHPKVCAEVLFKPMISWVISACEESGIDHDNICVVVSDRASEVVSLVPDDVHITVQEQRKGTGHAAMMAELFMAQAIKRNVTDVLVLCGDAPFISPDDIRGALSFHLKAENSATVLSSILPDGGDYGRIVRKKGRLTKIVEKKNADESTLKITEVNSGAYWFSIGFLLSNLRRLSPNSLTHEIYLTDLIGICVDNRLKCDAYPCNPKTVIGANDRAQLCRLNEIARDEIIAKHHQNGVSIPIKDSIIISPDVSISPDATILPGCIIKGLTKIGSGCVIGPNTSIDDCIVGENCVIDSSKLTRSAIGSNVRIGPFAQLRPDCTIADNVKIGNFVEVKNSTVGEKTSFAHLTYIGDSDFGKAINVGCGVVTVNYDGKGKYRTTVEDNAFIGCNTNLIAPVTVKEGAYVAAASTITEDVDKDALAIGRVKVVQKPGRALLYRKPKQ